MLQAREELEQEALFRWARLKAAGVRPGVPDVCLPVPRGEYHGLYIELKVGRNKPTEHQKAWLSHLAEAGYCALVCYGWEAAKESIEAYLSHRR